MERLMESLKKMDSKIYYITEEGRSIPFSEFLRQEREIRGCTWPALDRLCGVKRISAYATNTSGGKPNHPPEEVFLQIIGRLGYAAADFECCDLRINVPKLDGTEIEAVLRKIGDFIVEENVGKKRKWRFSSYIMRNVAGERFYGRYGRKSPEHRKALYEQLLFLDEKYKSIKFQRQKYVKGDNQHLRESEDFSEQQFLEQALLKYVDEYYCGKDKDHPKKWKKSSSEEKLPRGATIYACQVLNDQLRQHSLAERSLSSVRYHLQKIWLGYDKRISLTQGSPEPTLLEVIRREYLLREAAGKLRTDLFDLAAQIIDGGIKYNLERQKVVLEEKIR